MGSSHSVHEVVEEEESESEEEEEEEDEEEEDGRGDGPNGRRAQMESTHLVKKVLEQEPEMLPCHASASPLSPQLSSLGTPRLGPSIKVWDPYNVLAPPPPLPPPPPVFSRSFSIEADDRQLGISEVFLISHGECELSMRPDLIGGRCPDAGLTPNGKRQARALAVFLNSHGVRFGSVFSSPLDRARSMAALVCQEMNFAEEQMQSSDALTDMSHGHWEGCPLSEIYTSEISSLMDRLEPDFCAPGGESLRQVEFRMVQFINNTVLGLPDKLRSDLSSLHSPSETGLVNHISERDSTAPSSSLPSPRWDLLQRHRQGILRKKSGKSRLQFVTTEEENLRGSSSGIISCVGIFTHSIPIKCLITGLLGCSPVMSHKICVEESSVTVLSHSWKAGWQIKRVNDTAHLRLL
ncbi:uncharacterized protein LOC116213991 isoform X1 [Punica granatum]|uniref:Uncharacterized protein LOC116213991 isoform X1 n=1 Tax=Punica granatum TaxID=22663 RepID=A0A6P8EEV2_PUNGR|nr:uncharacterized protein LOC116213991 isoform X1 [Punica granatum]